jgi:Recombinase.
MKSLVPQNIKRKF